ncbi:MAG: UDP-N-acetylmuramyl peptide synthase [Methanobrevibacter sp.]|jgi:UDP-N-acetylmuramyl pentapeptide synthase|nr:UDP-N-acetylmuramyl peptide synthase [Candidatus Methanovirga basalitermitum]
MKNFKYLIAKIFGKIALHGVKLGKGMGKSFPGHLFLRIASYNGLKELAKNPKYGSIIVTGTNGKTTSTKILIKLMENDYKLATNYESNTINAVATALINDNVDFSIFEYGIRDVSNGIPDKIQELVDPVGVVYTNISREHTQVGGVKNKFENYLHAKSLLSKNMRKGIIISNGNNPYTAYIAKNKEYEAEKSGYDLKVNYFALALNLETTDKKCPVCSKVLQYHIDAKDNSNNDTVFYSCDCGFSKPKPQVEVTEIEIKEDEWRFRVSGNPYNYFLRDNFNFNFNCDFPPIGLHNINNGLTAITVYASFTSKPEKFEENVKKTFSKLSKEILPPGRFEIFEIKKNIPSTSKNSNQEKGEITKYVGLGQGDNGEALNVNVNFMKSIMKNYDIHFIYTSPDDYEEEIFDDHLKAIKKANPVKVSVLPGRNSAKMGEKSYNIIKESYNAEFYPTVDPDERINKIHEIILSSDMDYVIASGCGEEQKMWQIIKEQLRRKL